MRRQLGNLQVTLDEQKTQSKTLSDATWETISFLTDMAMAAKLGGRTRPMANAFLNFNDEKFKPILRNIPAQRDRSTQTARVQDGGIQDPAIRKESALEYAPTGVTQEWFKRGVMWCCHHRKAWTTVQAFSTTSWTTHTMTSLMTLTHTWSMARDTRTRQHLKMLFMESGAATQLTCDVTHTMTHDDSQ